MNIPNALKEFLHGSNGGELFALPAGVNVAGILGEEKRKRGIFYLEDNFEASKRVFGMPSNIFILADLNDGEVVGFDLCRTTLEDGAELFDYEGNNL